MGANIIDGKVVSDKVKSLARAAAAELRTNGVTPCLATVLVGDDPASKTYVNSKQKTATELGIATRDHRLGPKTSQDELLRLLSDLGNDVAIHGILVQLPLPKGIEEYTVVSHIHSSKDVDGLTPYNSGLLQHGRALLKPCTPSGIMELLDFYKIDPSGMNAVIINRSNLVGKPLTWLLLERNATVTVCHSKTKNLSRILLDADLIVTAVGNRERFVLNGDLVKQGAVVIDVGTGRSDGKLVGDVDFDSVREKASWITPVPGGVGPMTIAMLMKNTVTAASFFGGHKER